MTYNKADLHVHTTFSDGLDEPEAIVNYAVTQSDLRVVAITDHNTISGARVAFDYWQRHRAEFGALEVVQGIEVSSSAGHIVGLFLKEDIPPRLSPEDVVTAIHEQGGLAIAAHPFTHLLWFSDLQGIGRRIGELPLDGVEVRNSVPSELYANWLTEKFNQRHRNHTPVGGSDCHYLPMLGHTYTLFPGQTAADLRRAIETHTARAGGAVNGPRLVAQFVRDRLRRRQLPFVLPNDHRYRHATMDLAVTVEELRQAPIAILRCEGQIVRANADLLKAKASRLLEGGLARLIVDLRQVTFVDSAGLGAIVAALKRARLLGGGVTLCAPRREVALTLQLVRLDKVLGVHATLQEAVAALTTRAKRRADHEPK